jgi:hypothetical protein
MIYEFECRSCLGDYDYPCTLSFTICGSYPENDLIKCPFNKGPYHGEPKWELKSIINLNNNSFSSAGRKNSNNKTEKVEQVE